MDPITIKASQMADVTAPTISMGSLQHIGGMAIDLMIDRVRNKNLDLNDAPAKPYSPRGPIYIPLTGPGRSKASLGGVPVITPKVLRNIRGAGTITLHSRTRRSLKFANRAAYKRALGKSGNRDLEESGRMLGALTVLQTANTAPGVYEVTIGFTREEEEKKAEWNDAIDPWFGLSEGDWQKLEPVIEQVLGT